MAMARPAKKYNMKQNEKEQETAANKKQTVTYPQIDKEAVEIASKPSQVVTIIHWNVHIDIVAIVIHAHLLNIATGGATYKKELNRLKEDKGSARINFQDNPPSCNLLPGSGNSEWGPSLPTLP